MLSTRLSCARKSDFPKDKSDFPNIQQLCAYSEVSTLHTYSITHTRFYATFGGLPHLPESLSTPFPMHSENPITSLDITCMHFRIFDSISTYHAKYSRNLRNLVDTDSIASSKFQEHYLASPNIFRIFRHAHTFPQQLSRYSTLAMHTLRHVYKTFANMQPHIPSHFRSFRSTVPRLRIFFLHEAHSLRIFRIIHSYHADHL